MSLNIATFAASIGNPAKPFLFEVIVNFLPVLTIRAQTTQYPGVASTDSELYSQGQKILYAGSVEYENTWTVSVAESETGDMYRSIMAWRYMVYDQRTGQLGDPRDYKKIGIVRLKTSINTVWASMTLFGLYPKSIDTLDLDAAANTETVKWNLTFNYDYWI